MGEFSHIIDDMTWSYSRLESFEQCPFAWVNSYIYGEAKRSNFFSDFGTCMHTVLAEFFKKEIGKEDVVVRYIELFTNIKSRAPSQKIKDGRFSDGLSYLTSPLSTFSDLQKRKTMYVEEEFNTYIEGIPFTGFIDLVSMEDGEIVITDHKSSVIKPPSGRQKKTAYDIEREQKSRQLYIYAYAFKEMHSTWPDRLEFNCYRVPQIISVDFSQEEMDKTIRWVGETRNRISETNTFSPNVEPYYCKTLCDLVSCPYRDML